MRVDQKSTNFADLERTPRQPSREGGANAFSPPRRLLEEKKKSPNTRRSETPATNDSGAAARESWNPSPPANATRRPEAASATRVVSRHPKRKLPNNTLFTGRQTGVRKRRTRAQPPQAVGGRQVGTPQEESSAKKNPRFVSANAKPQGYARTVHRPPIMRESARLPSAQPRRPAEERVAGDVPPPQEETHEGKSRQVLSQAFFACCICA